jgi:hypothetical protein
MYGHLKQYAFTLHVVMPKTHFLTLVLALWALLISLWHLLFLDVPGTHLLLLLGLFEGFFW